MKAVNVKKKQPVVAKALGLNPAVNPHLGCILVN